MEINFQTITRMSHVPDTVRCTYVYWYVKRCPITNPHTGSNEENPKNERNRTSLEMVSQTWCQDLLGRDVIFPWNCRFLCFWDKQMTCVFHKSTEKIFPMEAGGVGIWNHQTRNLFANVKEWCVYYADIPNTPLVMQVSILLYFYTFLSDFGCSCHFLNYLY